ncbi:MAG: nucleotidyltransferase family protein [Thermodesulfobacteriota bacterium]|nr:nucleotidyltransferase family protein [Thermodesulfobacteriota bacterium]
MKPMSEINAVLQQHLNQLKRKFHVAEIGIFGSSVRGEQKNDSDIDILVEFSRPVDFFLFMQLETHLSRILEANIDLVSRKALKPHIGRRILEEVQYVS